MHIGIPNQKAELWSIEKVCDRLGMSRATFLRIRKNPHKRFPTSFPFGARERWLSTDVERWIYEHLYSPPQYHVDTGS